MNEEASSAGSPSWLERVPGWVWFIAKLFFFLTSLCLGRIGVFRANNFIQMPIVWKALDPSLYPNDAYVETLRYYPIPIWHWIYPLFSFGKPFIVLGILTVLTRLFVFWAAGRLAYTLTNGSRFAEVCAWALFAVGSNPPVAEATIYPYTFQHTALSIGFILLGYTQLFKKRIIPWAICLGIIGLLNLLYGIFSIVFFAAIILASPEHRKDVGKWVLAAFGSLVLMTPSILMSWQVFKLPKLQPHYFALLNRLNFPYHYFPSVWTSVQWTRLAIIMALMIAIAIWAKWPKDARVAALVTSALVPIFIAIAYFGADKQEISLLISTQPARSTDVWYPFVTVAMAAIFARMISAGTRPAHPVIGAAGLLLGGYYWHYGWHGDTVTGNLMGIVGGVLLALGLVLLPFGKLAAPKWSKYASAGAVGGMFALESILAFNRFYTGDLVADVFQPPQGPETPVYEWIKKNTDKGARFLINPFKLDFRALAERTPYFIMREGSALMWEPKYADDWAERLRTLGVNADQDDADHYQAFLARVNYNYSSITDQYALELAKYGHLDYWIVSSHRFTWLSSVYDDGRYKILKLKE